MIHNPTRVSAALAAFALLFATAPRASADYINLTLNSAGNSVTYKPYGGSSVTVGAGPFQWTQATPINTGYPGSLTTYCIDLDDSITQGKTYKYDATTDLSQAPTIGNNSVKIGEINQLFNMYYKSSLASGTVADAFQIALWELLYDGATSLSLTKGRIQASNSTAQNMLNSLKGADTGSDLNGYQLVALISCDGHQDQITVIPCPPPPSGVPAPPGVVLAGVGMIGLIGRARWTRRTPSDS